MVRSLVVGWALPTSIIFVILIVLLLRSPFVQAELLPVAYYTLNLLLRLGLDP
jgi:hypothetical protein